jgi:tetratricopeptide (TPR) repeat protein
VNAATPNAETDGDALQDLRFRGLTSRGLAYLELGKLSEAKADLQDIVRLSPHSSSAMVNLAKVFTAEKNYQQALQLYQNALSLDSQNFDAASGVVATFINLGEPAKAHQQIDSLLTARAGQASMMSAFHYLNSTIFIAEKNNAAAEQELLSSIELDENYLPSYTAYASLLASQDRTEEAIAQYQKVIAKRPAAQTYTMLGILEDGRGNTEAAESNYRPALQIAPDTSIEANNLAWLIAENHGNLDEALQLATAAVSKNQSVPGYYDTLGWVYMKKGLYSPAVEQMRKAVAMDEANAQKNNVAITPGYRVRLSLALAKAGDKTSARREAEISLKYASALSQREANDAKSVLASS